MTFGQAVQTCLEKYLSFDGRAARSEFWWWTAFVVLGNIAASILDAAVGFLIGLPILGALFGLAVFLPGIMVSIRRLHDQDRSGWWLLISLVPVIGFLVLLYWFITPGTDGDNEFGPDPLA